ncbi:MAG: DUF4368 domain-containing protein [Oscillospiraceae bacterium]|nr:DUF4368 domain-containing protein [Oscillospiraceae bacterium]
MTCDTIRCRIEDRNNIYFGTVLKELTPELVNTLIQRIEVHNSDRSGGKIRVKVDVYFTAAGLIDLPTEKELEKLIAEYEKEHAEKNRSKAAAS